MSEQMEKLIAEQFEELGRRVHFLERISGADRTINVYIRRSPEIGELACQLSTKHQCVFEVRTMPDGMLLIVAMGQDGRILASAMHPDEPRAAGKSVDRIVREAAAKLEVTL